MGFGPTTIALLAFGTRSLTNIGSLVHAGVAATAMCGNPSKLTKRRRLWVEGQDVIGKLVDLAFMVPRQDTCDMLYILGKHRIIYGICTHIIPPRGHNCTHQALIYTPAPMGPEVGCSGRVTLGSYTAKKEDHSMGRLENVCTVNFLLFSVVFFT